jgi:N-acetyltransferase
MTCQIQPVTLIGQVVALVPLAEEHVEDLTVAAQDDNIWRFMRYGSVRTPEQVRAFVQQWLEWQAQGTDLPFAVIHRASGRAIGMTRYMEISAQNQNLEIGGTWYAVTYQRTVVNTESKYLLLYHAFESLGCIRVQIKTDVRNERSQRAIERLGAVREGVLRNHMILPDGTIRSSVFYSILVEEWPAVKAHLQELLER